MWSALLWEFWCFPVGELMPYLPPKHGQDHPALERARVLFPCRRFVLRISPTVIIQDYLPISRSLTISVRSGISSWNLGGWEGHFSVSCPTLCICTSPLLSSLLKLTVRIKWCSRVGAFANKIPPALPFELSSFLLAWPACSTLKCPSRDYGCIQEWGEVRAAEWHRGMRNQTLLACAYGVCMWGEFQEGERLIWSWTLCGFSYWAWLLGISARAAPH